MSALKTSEDWWRVHRNITKEIWSVMWRSQSPVKHRLSLLMEDCTFHVQPAGRDRARREQVKNVHAYVKGTLSNEVRMLEHAMDTYGAPVQLVYSPYHNGPYFTRAGFSDPIGWAMVVYFDGHGKCWAWGQERAE